MISSIPLLGRCPANCRLSGALGALVLVGILAQTTPSQAAPKSTIEADVSAAKPCNHSEMDASYSSNDGGRWYSVTGSSAGDELAGAQVGVEPLGIAKTIPGAADGEAARCIIG